MEHLEYDRRPSTYTRAEALHQCRITFDGPTEHDKRVDSSYSSDPVLLAAHYGQEPRSTYSTPGRGGRESLLISLLHRKSWTHPHPKRSTVPMACN